MRIVEILAMHELVMSHAAARRAILCGGVFVDGEKVTDVEAVMPPGARKLRLGRLVVAVNVKPSPPRRVTLKLEDGTVLHEGPEATTSAGREEPAAAHARELLDEWERMDADPVAEIVRAIEAGDL